MVGLWTGPDAAEGSAAILETSKADMIASTLREATRLSIEAARPEPEGSRNVIDVKISAATRSG
jgi:hypothetical protein